LILEKVIRTKTGAFQIYAFLLPHPAQSLPPAPSEGGGEIQERVIGSKFEMHPPKLLKN
jgi:hypothetical protein